MYKPIKGYEYRYLISDQGAIKSLYGKKEKILIPCINTIGYIESVLIDKNGKRKNEKWHRLVAETFIPNPENKPCINHKNGIKIDNRVENLEWCTDIENKNHARKILGRQMGAKKGIFPKQFTRKLSREQVIRIRERLNNGEQGKIIAKDYRVCDQTIYDIKNKRCWLLS